MHFAMHTSGLLIAKSLHLGSMLLLLCLLMKRVPRVDSILEVICSHAWGRLLTESLKLFQWRQHYYEGGGLVSNVIAIAKWLDLTLKLKND